MGTLLAGLVRWTGWDQDGVELVDLFMHAPGDVLAFP